MKLLFEAGSLYVNGVKLCKYEAQNDLRVSRGIYPIEATYAHVFGKVLPRIDGVGYIGVDPGCAVHLGQVLGKSGLIADEHYVRVLVGRLEDAAEKDTSVLAEIV